MSWHTQTLVGFDLETTGTDPESDRIVTASVVWVDVSARAVDTKQWLADPGLDIPDAATAVHGISTEHARQHGRPAGDVAEAVFVELSAAWRGGAPVVVFNAPFDLTLLDRELRRHHRYGLGSPGPVVDPLVIDRSVDRYRKGPRKLTSLCEHYRIRLDDAEAHTSSGDALAATRLAWCLARRYSTVGADLGALQCLQSRWYAGWAEQFESYLRRRKASEGATPEETASVVIDRGWPLRPYAGEGVA